LVAIGFGHMLFLGNNILTCTIRPSRIPCRALRRKVRRAAISHRPHLFEQFWIDHARQKDKHALLKADLPGSSEPCLQPTEPKAQNAVAPANAHERTMFARYAETCGR
jgi:hypothetical protein